MRLRGWFAGWRLALRMAFREARRDRTRSGFVWLMICLPVAAICATQVILASQEVAPAEFLDQRLGQGSARLTWIGTRFEPTMDAYRQAVEARDENDPVEPALPIPGWGESIQSQRAAIAAWTGQPAFALTLQDVTVADGGEIVGLLGTDPDAAIASGILRLSSGRLPQTPDEVLATPAWTSRGLPASGTVTAQRGDGGGLTRRIVGTAEVRLDTVVGLVGLPDLTARERSFLLTGDRAIGWEDAREFAQHGFETTSRGIAADPPQHAPQVSYGLSVSYGGLVSGGALLEVALIVGPAFAIGAARQRRGLALAATNGAGVGQLRRLALGQAVLLGSTGSAAGVLLGVGVGVGGWSLIASDPRDVHGPLEVPPFVAVVLVLGALTAIVAALLPTRGLGRLDLVAALQGSARSAPPLRQAHWWGLGLVFIGLATSWFGAGLDRYGDSPIFAVWFGGLVAAVTGVLLTLPAELDGRSRLAPGPVVLRMALRDLGRQRGRATATLAAIVSGSLLLGVVWTWTASIGADIARQYVPRLPYGQGQASSTIRTAPGIEQTVTRVDPTLRTAVVGEIWSWSPDGSVESGHPLYALRPGCSLAEAEGPTDRCASLGSDDRYLLAASVEDLAWLFGLDPAQQAVLRSGGALVDTSPPTPPMRTGRNELIDGQLRLAHRDPGTGGDGAAEHTIDLPALPVTAALVDRGASSGRVGALVSLETAASHRFAADAAIRIVDPAGPISPELEARLQAAIDDPDWGLRVERGYQEVPDRYVALLTVTLSLMEVVAAAMATVLAAAEQRPFLATFAAVGASPGLGRNLATTQAALLALLGTVVGFGLGLLAGIPMALASTSVHQMLGPVLVIPWQPTLLVIGSISLIAAGVAAISVPARQVLVRRAG